MTATDPTVQHFFDEPTNTFSYVVQDPASNACAIIDPVLDFDYAAGSTSTAGADAIIAHVREHGLQVAWILETHVHADHLSAASYLHAQLGGQTGIGADICQVQEIFGKVFNAGSKFACDGSQFDRLFKDNDSFAIGGLWVQVLHTPGHTPACVTYVVGSAAFVGDTLFMPDYGTARCDFPGGDARALYRSIRRVLALPDTTRLFLCHDYKAPGRDSYAHETTVAAQHRHNVHVHDGISEDAFAAMRNERDATLNMPRLTLPAVQINMRAGELPPAEENGRVYLKIPLNLF